MPDELKLKHGDKKYKYIKFVEVPLVTYKTLFFSCRNNRTNNELGFVEWHEPWKQYCYFPNTEAVYSAECLNDISAFLKEIKDA